MITGIVLAGGRSSRFSGDKLAAELDGVPVLHHALLATARATDALVLVLAPSTPAPALPPGLQVPMAVARDAQPGGGPLAGLAAGLAAVGEDARQVVLVVGGDMPWLEPAVLRLLATRVESAEPVVAMTLGTASAPPLPMAIRVAMARAAVAACLAGGRRSLRSLLEAVPSAALPEPEWRALDPEGRTLWDVDVPADLEARRRAGT